MVYGVYITDYGEVRVGGSQAELLQDYNKHELGLELMPPYLRVKAKMLIADIEKVARFKWERVHAQ